MKHDAMNIFLTKVFLTVGTLAGGTVHMLQSVDLVLGVLLKTVSIISFIIVIVINLDKFTEKIYNWTRKKHE